MLSALAMHFNASLTPHLPSYNHHAYLTTPLSFDPTRNTTRMTLETFATRAALTDELPFDSFATFLSTWQCWEWLPCQLLSSCSNTHIVTSSHPYNLTVPWIGTNYAICFVIRISSTSPLEHSWNESVMEERVPTTGYPTSTTSSLAAARSTSFSSSTRPSFALLDCVDWLTFSWKSRLTPLQRTTQTSSPPTRQYILLLPTTSSYTSTISILLESFSVSSHCLFHRHGILYYCSRSFLTRSLPPPILHQEKAFDPRMSLM